MSYLSSQVEQFHSDFEWISDMNTLTLLKDIKISKMESRCASKQFHIDFELIDHMTLKLLKK